MACFDAAPLFPVSSNVFKFYGCKRLSDMALMVQCLLKYFYLENMANCSNNSLWSASTIFLANDNNFELRFYTQLWAARYSVDLNSGSTYTPENTVTYMLALQATSLSCVWKMTTNWSASIKQMKGFVSKMSNLKQENLFSDKLIRVKFPLL